MLLNTCSVRDNAEQKAINKMENIAGDIRKHRPDVVLGFLGCMAQSRGQELIDRLPDVDLVVGTQKFHRTADYLDEILAGRRDKIVDTAEEQGSEGTIREHLLNGSGEGQIRHGVCQHHARLQSILHLLHRALHARRGAQPDALRTSSPSAGSLASQGVKEITLLGQIVTSYGKRRRSTPLPDPSGERVAKPGERYASAHGREIRFVQLIEAVHEIEGLERIRFTSPHPKGYGDDLVEAYARLPKLVESAHLPVQSGSDRVLKLMHRGYTRERFLEIIRKLRAVRPGIGITSDIIVGFPGETEDGL